MSSASAAKANKKSAFSCEPCRRRKVKCGGEQPVCARCAARNDTCTYKLNPTLSYTQRLEDRIRQLEEQLAGSSSGGTTRLSSKASSLRSSPTPASGSDASLARQSMDGDGEIIGSFAGLSLGTQGHVTYHGPASFFRTHYPQRGDLSSTHGASLASSEFSEAQRRISLVTASSRQLAFQNATEIPEPFRYLLSIHWCWVNPLFSFTYRPLFTRDMQTMGPYYSHLLLNAVLLHSLRYALSNPTITEQLDKSYEGGAIFGKHARNMLMDELSSGACSVPTIQALLLLSSNECAAGNAAQAWAYSGLCFRMMDHLGVCVDARHHAGLVALNDEDIEVRHRLFWSAYIYDKLISLYLGRAPSLQLSSLSPPLHSIVDNHEDDQSWAPFGASPNIPAQSAFPLPSHSLKCFAALSQVSIILNEVLLHMYDPLGQNTNTEMERCYRSQSEALQDWWERLDESLRIDVKQLPELVPPSHIITLNIIYYMTTILVYKPFTVSPRDLEGARRPSEVAFLNLYRCSEAACAIMTIHKVAQVTFSTVYTPTSILYGVYHAITVFILCVQTSRAGYEALDDKSLYDLQDALRSLAQARRGSPLVQTIVNLLEKDIYSLGLAVDPIREEAVYTGYKNKFIRLN